MLLRAQDDSLKGAWATKCSKFDLEKFENSIILLKGACAPMQGNMVFQQQKWYLRCSMDESFKDAQKL